MEWTVTFILINKKICSHLVHTVYNPAFSYLHLQGGGGRICKSLKFWPYTHIIFRTLFLSRNTAQEWRAEESRLCACAHAEDFYFYYCRQLWWLHDRPQYNPPPLPLSSDERLALESPECGRSWSLWLEMDRDSLLVAGVMISTEWLALESFGSG
jgi:hypothetical protein